MFTTKAKIITFTTISIIAALGIGTAALFIRDGNNKSYLTAVERDISDFCDETYYGTTAYSFKCSKSNYDAEDSKIEFSGYLSETMDFNSCDYVLFYVENTTFSSFLKCNFKIQKANVFEKLVQGLDAVKFSCDFEKSFNGQTFFTPVAFIDDEISTGYLIKNNIYSSCIIESYLSVNSFEIESESIILREGGGFQSAEISIMNKSHKNIKLLTFEKDGEEIDFPANELSYEENVSNFKLTFEEQKVGYHFIRLKSATFLNDFGEEEENALVSTYKKYTALEGISFVSSSIQELTNDGTISGSVVLKNPNSFSPQKILILINGTNEVEVPLTFFATTGENSTYNFTFSLNKSEYENGSILKLKIKKIFFLNRWDMISDDEKNVLLEYPAISGFEIMNTINEVSNFKIVLEHSISNLKGGICNIVYAGKDNSISLTSSSDNTTLVGSLNVGRNSGYRLRLTSVTIRTSLSSFTFDVDFSSTY